MCRPICACPCASTTWGSARTSGWSPAAAYGRGRCRAGGGEMGELLRFTQHRDEGDCGGRYAVVGRCRIVVRAAAGESRRGYARNSDGSCHPTEGRKDARRFIARHVPLGRARVPVRVPLPGRRRLPTPSSRRSVPHAVRRLQRQDDAVRESPASHGREGLSGPRQLGWAGRLVVPGIKQFDHMIAGVERAGRIEYADVTPSLLKYAELPSALQGEVGLALPEGRARVVVLPASPPDRNRYDREIVGALGLDGRFTGRITVTALGTEESSLREKFADIDRQDPQARNALLRKYAEAVYDGAVVDSSHYFDGRDLGATPR